MSRQTVYSQLINTVHYPKFDTPLWVVIDRITERPTRVVEGIHKVRHHAEIALPLPSGEMPEKSVEIPYLVQRFNNLTQPLYDNAGSPTTDDVDGSGVPYPPFLVSAQEEIDVNLRDAPNLFSLDEVVAQMKVDILDRYPFYDQIHFILFDDRLDSLSLYGDQYESTGFGAGSVPFMIGPIQATFGTPDGVTAIADEVLGHVMLMAPNVGWVEYFLQIRHGLDIGGKTGPLVDIEQATRTTPLPEVYRINPFEDFALTTEVLRDNATVPVDNSYFWIRARYKPYANLLVEGHVFPWIAILIRTSGETDG